MGGGASHLLNFLIYKKKSRKMLFATEKLEIFYIFGQKNRSNFRKGSSFVRFAPSEAKKKKKLQNFWRNAHIHKIRTRSTFEKFATSSEKEILGMGLVEASQMHRIRKQGGGGA